jgi:RNA polymerase sigma-70 factor (ECF subfamily)
MGARTATISQDQADAGLLAAISQSRDAVAFAEFSKRYETQSFNLAYNITGNRAWAEETVQEAMLRVWTSAASYRADGPVSAWVMRIVAREAMKTLKTAKRASSRIKPDESAEREAPPQASPLRNVEASELQHALRSEFDRLPELERQLIGMHFGGGLSQQEIGDALSMPQQTISYRLNETLKVLRSKLSSAGFAAAVPMLAGRGLMELLSSGRAAPMGLHGKILAKAALPRVSVRVPRSVRRAPVKAGSGMVMAGVAVVVAVAGVAGWAISAKETPPPKPVVAAAPVVAVPAPVQVAAPQPAPIEEPPLDLSQQKMTKLKDWHRRWIFEKGAPKDLFVAMGNWKWNRAAQTMDVADEVRFFPFYVLPDYPLMFTLRGKGIDTNKTVTSGVQLISDGKLAGDKRLWRKQHDLTNWDVEQKVYIYRNRIVGSMNGQVGLISEHGEKTEDSAIIFQIVNYSIKEIVATPLTESEVPDFVKNPEKLIKDMEAVKIVPPEKK